MKKYIFIIIFIFIFNNFSFSQDESSFNKKNQIYLGFNFGIGSSWQLSTTLVNGEITPKIALQFGARAIFHFSENVAILTDMGAYIFNTKASNYIETREYELHYFYISASPSFVSRNIYLSLGLYFGIIGYANYEKNNYKDKSKDYYTIPDIGLNFNTGYMIKLSKLMDLFINLNIKYQLSNFRNDDMGIESGKIFSIMLDLSLFFEL